MSTSSRYSIAEAAVARHAGNLDQTHAAMNTALTQFSSALAGLPGVWRGASYGSFAEVQGQWQRATTDLNRALDDIRGRVTRSATLYDTGEADQAASLRQVGQSVDWAAGTFRG